MLGAGPQSRIRQNSVTATVASVHVPVTLATAGSREVGATPAPGTGVAFVAVVASAGEPRRYMFEYSGPLPPSGGVNRPPLAVIAPHCTQFDGASFSCTVGPPSSRPIS